MQRNPKCDEPVSVPDAADRLTAVAYAIAATYPRGEHGQLCPVWTKRATLELCDCWRMRNALAAARGALKALETFDQMAAGVEHKANRA